MLVRHAHAGSRHDWDSDDKKRPLSEKGYRQARLLVPVLQKLGPKRILSSPYLRCVETVEPVAEALGLAVEEERRLGEGSGRAAVQLVRDLAGEDAVICSHGDVIPDVLSVLLVEDGTDLGPDRRVEKASVWILEWDSGRFRQGTYTAPPMIKGH